MLTTTSALRRTAATLGAVGALTALGLAPAAAHDEVLSTSPEQDAVLETAPEEIELTYSGEIMDIGHQVADTGAQDGTYQVVWRVVSSDGHPIEGTYTYEVGDGADTTTPAPSLSSSPTQVPADSSDGSTEAQDAAAQENSEGLSGGAIGVTVVVLALVVIGLLALMSRRRRKS